MSLIAPIRNQFYSVVCGHFLTISFGAINGWATVNFVDLQKDDTTFPSGPLTLSQATFIMSIPFITTIIGNFVLPPFVRKFGCKRMMHAMGFPQIIVWLLIIYAQNHYYLYAARALSGLVAAAVMMNSPMFVLDVCFDRFRGTLFSLFDPFWNLGPVMAFVLAKYFDYVGQAKIHLIVSILFVILFARIPNTPQHLVNVQKQEAANKAHLFYKGTELEILPVNEENNKHDDAKLTWSDFTNRRAKKAICLCIAMKVLSTLTGGAVIVSYITDILASSNSNISPVDASIGITIMLIFASFIFINLVDRAGRRVFCIGSSVASTIGLVLFAAYLYYLSDNHKFDWVPIGCISFVLLAGSFAPNMILYEITPEKIKSYFFPFCFTLRMIINFILTQIFPEVKEYIGLAGWIVFYALMNFCGALFAIFLVPETRGKSHEEIMQMFDR